MAYVEVGQATRRGTTKGQPETQDVRIDTRTTALKVLAERGQLAPHWEGAVEAPWYKSTMVLVLGGVALLGGAFFLTRGKTRRRR